MLQNFVLCDGDLGDKQVGTFSYDAGSMQYTMTIAKDIAKSDLPLSLEGFVNRNKYDLSHEDALRWVRGRVCPPGRHNMRDILKDNGLREYDEFQLLITNNGKCDKDALYLVSTP